jgi:hypothetical protein
MRIVRLGGHRERDGCKVQDRRTPCEQDAQTLEATGVGVRLFLEIGGALDSTRRGVTVRGPACEIDCPDVGLPERARASPKQWYSGACGSYKGRMRE